MVQGLHSKFKQVVGYFFTESGVSADVLIKDVVRAVRSTGFIPVASSSDMGGTNQGAVNRLKDFEGGASPKDPWCVKIKGVVFLKKSYERFRKCE